MNVTAVVLQVIIAIVPITASFFAFRQAGRATRTTVESTEKISIRSAELERDKVDALAFTRASAIYESSLSQMERDLDRVRAELQSERDRARFVQGQMEQNLDQVQNELQTERNRSRTLQSQVESLERRVQELQSSRGKEE